MDDKEIKAIRPDALAPAEIAAKTEAIGATKATMGLRQSFVLAIMAGLFIGLGGMFMLLIKSDASFSPAVSQILGGLVFCTGLFLVICAGAELFTGNCLMIIGRLSGGYSWAAMLKNWVVVYLGNLVGSLLLVALLLLIHYYTTNSGGVGNAMLSVAAGKIDQPWQILLFKGVMCNLLVCLAVWVSYAARTIVDKFFAIILPITAFVACGFEHCIANMFFLPLGLALRFIGFDYTGSADISKIDVAGVLYNLSAVTIGNIIGGVLLVGLVYWFVYRKKQGRQ
ncbi:MAG: formate/nitrite transporter family protein [Coriobacteriales bacterium]|nr:formate/nitrite transporter family protein [Coriobacteriales bacterium]